MEENDQFKFCPKCGTPREETVNFCPKCGYSYENPQPEKKTGNIKETFGKVIKWIKSHLKIVIPAAVAVLLVIILAITIPSCIAAKNNGTYYKLEFNGELDRGDFVKISSGKWEDNDGEKGTYKLSGETVTLYITFMGSTEELASGTLSDGVLSLDVGGGMKETYISEKHKHSFGEWETVSHNCVKEGLQRRTCACGVKEEQALPAIGHHTYGEWVTTNFNCIDGGTHRRTCICGDYEEEPLPPTGSHSFENWTVTKEADWSVYGEKSSTCTVCNEVTTQKIDRLAEDFYSLLEVINEENNFAYCITVNGHTDAYQFFEDKVLINDYETYFYNENGTNYRLDYKNEDGKWHKTVCGSYESSTHFIAKLKAIFIEGRDNEEYSVIFDDEAFIMTCNEDYIILTNSETQIKVCDIGNTVVEIPTDRYIIDDTKL